MADAPTQPKKPTITEEIMEMLEQNGNIDRSVKDRLMLKAIGEVLHKLDALDELEKRVKELERRNIATVFIKHPISAALITFSLFIVLNVIAHSISVWSLTIAILKMLGFPIPT